MTRSQTIAAIGHDAIQRFFDHYAASLVACDFPTLHHLYSFPALYVTNEISTPYLTINDVETDMRSRFSMFCDRGIMTGRILVRTVDAISPRLVNVDVDWDFFTGEGKSVMRRGFRYLLRLGLDEDLLIQIVIAR